MNVTMDEIHGYVCDDCGRTHCANARDCTCNGPGCQGTVTRLEDVLD